MDIADTLHVDPLPPPVLLPEPGPIPDLSALDGLDRQEIARGFAAARPFPHVVIDGALSVSQVRSLVDSYGEVGPDEWHVQKGPLQRKARTRPGAMLPDRAQRYFDLVHSGRFLRFLTEVTGIGSLIPDPELHGGGMHDVQGGGYFDVHVDFPRHPRTGLDNRLTVITYLNEDWSEADGGALELWQADPRRRVEAILPLAGRMVIFGQSARALHGHPGPVQGSRHRRALISYYYTSGLADRPAAVDLPTRYLRRPGQTLTQRLEVTLRPLTPPLLAQLAAGLHRKLR